MESQTISVPTAGRLLSISRVTAYKAAKSGQLPTIRMGRRILVPKAAIEKMLQVEPKAGVER